MVKSTTSSHYSVFSQRIPNYDLKYVRNYTQFKNRLEGMELCLKQIDRNIWRKEVQCSECFVQETLAIWKLFQEFTKNQVILDLIVQYYNLLNEYDSLMTKRIQLVDIVEQKTNEISKLISEYNQKSNSQMDEKIYLGNKIKSIRLELSKTLQVAIESIDKRLDEIVAQLSDLKKQILEKKISSAESIWSSINTKSENWQKFKDKFGEVLTDIDDKDGMTIIQRKMNDLSNRQKGHEEKLDQLVNFHEQGKPNPNTEPESVTNTNYNSLKTQEKITSIATDHIIEIDVLNERGYIIPERNDDVDKQIDLSIINGDELEKLVRETERWRGYMFNLGYELNQLKQIKIIADDATIKVRRLVHNFKERIDRVISESFTSSYGLRNDVTFTNITSSSIRDIILAFDWFAANPDGRTFTEMGFPTKDAFLVFRKKCNNMSLYLRKNQYRKVLSDKRYNLIQLINDLNDKIEDRHQLKYDDKYGEEAKVKEEKPWSIDDVSQKKVNKLKIFGEAFNQVSKIIDSQRQSSEGISTKENKLSVFADADMELDRQTNLVQTYMNDLSNLKSRTINYMKSIGLIQTEDDIEGLVIRNLSSNYQGNINQKIKKIEDAKTNLDYATSKMLEHRKTIQSIIDNIANAEKRIAELKQENVRLFNNCISIKNKHVKNRVLITRLDNENKIIELQNIVKTSKKKHLSDFSALESLRDEVDKKQQVYDESIREFKDDIGLNEQVISDLMVGIYNKYQDEILDIEDE